MYSEVKHGIIGAEIKYILINANFYERGEWSRPGLAILNPTLPWTHGGTSNGNLHSSSYAVHNTRATNST